MERTILHSDMNSCYASIELLHHPELRGKPLAVAGREEDRHGVVLSKDELARRAGVKTGMTVWEARRRCPELNLVEPHLALYQRFSEEVRELYALYTDRQEPFGLDESWLDLSGCVNCPSGPETAEEIRRRVKRELGVTVSIGVSWNKVFAKLGSDCKKPDAVTVIARESFRRVIWPMAVEKLLFVGPATSRRLRGMGVRTIGELALADPEALRLRLGKAGVTLHAYANGWDSSPVARRGEVPPIKSVGNSTTTPRDMVCERDVMLTLSDLADGVSGRLRKKGLAARGIEFSARSGDLSWRSCRMKLDRPTDISCQLRDLGLELFRRLRPAMPLRSVGLRCYDLSPGMPPEQMDMFGDLAGRDAMRALDRALDDIRRRHGSGAVHRGFIQGEAARDRISPLPNPAYGAEPPGA